MLTQDHLSKLVSRVRARYRLPAVAVSVMSDAAMLVQEIQGTRVVDRPDPVTLDDYFHIGSCAKSVLALIAARLIGEGRIAWQSRFFAIFPELVRAADEAYRDITLEDLFLCEAGIKSYTDAQTEPLPAYAGTLAEQRQAFIVHLVGLAPCAERSAGRFRHLYSNASYTMAAAMLERVSGRGYEHLVTQTLAGDLGLSVHIGWPNSIGPDQPWGHRITSARVEALAPDHEYRLPGLIAPAGDLSMTPRDYARYTQLHLRGLRGADHYLSGDAYRYIHLGRDGFSLGVANGVFAGKRFSGFDGSAGTFFCRSIIVPESNVAFAIMTNAGTGGGSMEAVDRLTLRLARAHFNWWWKLWMAP